MSLAVRSCSCLKSEDAKMAQAATTHHHEAISTNRFLEFCASWYDWLATWAERNVEPGEDGNHIPKNVRNILENRGYDI